MSGRNRRRNGRIKKTVDREMRDAVYQWQRGLKAVTTRTVRELAGTGKYAFRDMTPVFDRKTRAYVFKDEETIVIGKGNLWGNMWQFRTEREADWARAHPDTLADCGFSIYESSLGLFIGIENPSYDFFGEHWIPLYEAMGIAEDSSIEKVHGREKTNMGKTENKEAQNGVEKVRIYLHKQYCKVLDSKINEGEKYNVMFMPKGVILNGKDIGGSMINPRFMSASQGNENVMVATYYINDPEKGLKIKLSHKDREPEKVDIKELKEAIDTRWKEYLAEKRKQEDQQGESKERSKSRQKEQGAEL